MKHNERIVLAEYILKKLKKKHGKKILIAGAYGSVARNKDSEKSDLDMLIITRNGVGWISDKFLFNGIPVDYWSKSIKDVENIIKYPNFYDWPWALNTYLNFKFIVGDKKIQKKLKDCYENVSLPKCYKAVEEYMPSLYEWNTKIQKSYAKKDNGNLIFAIWDTMNGILGCVALINKKYFIGNGYDRFRESFKFKLKPKNYKKLVEIAYISKNPEKSYHAYMKLFNNFEKLLLSKGIAVKNYRRKEDIIT
ncbi:MAG: nucleotidyltransferase domain-containing protein [Nanoarchaeota archaeon]|nr:nucleotidyltransferase domain-containing protein [Nanoarchaeota archaeon]MBU4124144.1 nucleotidyltransferase domain-containing protein [Nanoarchaeota archaeon]